VDILRSLHSRWIIALLVYVALLAIPVVLSLLAPAATFAAR
jgi:hypothetical protein